MKVRSNTIIKFEEDTSSMQRIEAWKMASLMLRDHPIFGVGLGNFMLGWEKYSSSKPRVAHSTIIQFAAENGIFAALAFAVIFVIALFDLYAIRKEARKKYSSDAQRAGGIISMANALEGGCIGFFVCGLFLSLGSYEIYFIIIMIISLLHFHTMKEKHENGHRIISEIQNSDNKINNFAIV